MNSFSVFLKGFQSGMHLFGSRIARIVNTVLLFFVYIFGVGISAVLVKLSGKRLLTIHLDRHAKTYWEPLDLKKRPLQKYYRQF